ncbi:hypothetical protein [Acinetobacter pittii]|uniref:hypothetical protein n=1 Tax=Acinetobacter pittii TaxID=48296 RepID=UPI0021CDDB70|nr:hypothetical protein [Acinetobacter pittii]MCU4334760.1 hypothetical protein [Acinetobacter pittii]
MSNTTKVLREQAGIQYQGVQDKSEADPRDTLSNAIFTGVFKRGRFDKPIKITSSNIRAKLGYDPSNLTYMAVEDCLKTGTPFVWVMRTENDCNCSSTRIQFKDNQRVVMNSVATLRYRLDVNEYSFVEVEPETDSYSLIDGIQWFLRSEIYGQTVDSLFTFNMENDEFTYTLENVTNSCEKIKLTVDILDINAPGNDVDKQAQQSIELFNITLCANKNEQPPVVLPPSLP